MRLPCAGLALAFVLLAASAAPALAQTVTGEIKREPQANTVVLELRNSSLKEHNALEVRFPPGTRIVSARLRSGVVVGDCHVDPDGLGLVCLFQPPRFWFPDDLIVIEVVTADRMPDNAGAAARVQSTDGSSSTFQIPGPRAFFGTADLGIRVDLVRPASSVFPRPLNILAFSRRPRSAVAFAVDLFNRGPDDVGTAALVGSVRGTGAGTRVVNCLEGLSCLEIKPTSLPEAVTRVRRALSVIRAGRRRRSFVQVSANTPRQLGIRISFIPDSGPGVTDPSTRNNTARATAPPLPKHPRSTVGASADPGAGPTLSGRAFGLAFRVAFAIYESVGGGNLASTPVAGGSSAGAGSAAPGCRWLANARARFQLESGRRCDEPRYLIARVRNGRWRLQLRRPLPPGSYVMFSRAVNRGGWVESSIHPRLGNIKRLRVR